mmetsp:Transcript_65381/g.188368  ORF Transcript_65381/g.188368 Transcript_65381/m.188368 type:complete len:225 (-) Transcript_65381:485-1159(-)
MRRSRRAMRTCVRAPLREPHHPALPAERLHQHLGAGRRHPHQVQPCDARLRLCLRAPLRLRSEDGHVVPGHLLAIQALRLLRSGAHEGAQVHPRRRCYGRRRRGQGHHGSQHDRYGVRVATTLPLQVRCGQQRGGPSLGDADLLGEVLQRHRVHPELWGAYVRREPPAVYRPLVRGDKDHAPRQRRRQGEEFGPVHPRQALWQDDPREDQKGGQLVEVRCAGLR